MKFPHVIEDRFELNRLMDADRKMIVLHTLNAVGLYGFELTQNACINLSSRRQIENAVKSGDLKFRKKGNKHIINKDKFFDWLINQ